MAAFTSFILKTIAIAIFLACSATAQISSGYATYSNGNGGVCSGGGSLPSVSINAAQFANGAACGQCVQISGTGSGAGSDPVSTAPYIAQIGNVCPQCNYGDLDLQESGDGKYGVTWSFVGCPGGRKLIEQPFNGDNTVYQSAPQKEQETETSEAVAEETPVATPAAAPQEEKHFIVHQKTEHFIVHQATETPAEQPVVESSAEEQSPSVSPAQETAEIQEVATHLDEEDKAEEAPVKVSRRLLMAN